MKMVNLFTVSCGFDIDLGLIAYPGRGCHHLALQVISIPGKTLQQLHVGVELAVLPGQTQPCRPLSVLGGAVHVLVVFGSCCLQ